MYYLLDLPLKGRFFYLYAFYNKAFKTDDSQKHNKIFSNFSATCGYLTRWYYIK
ncbi:hypothetical protein HMPREF0204_14065 [Chryseobacterium gleum ATCC 35910]|uniref:Uncharacterized protein n=1 Tax=Chryseobacterium gleum ATCC 35910 TaxID=525257 RepID=A0ABP2IMT3_CHRGE|nr:hypothetical protein HMPREF0204_14065 [Chryseobacterium gleum ATCC 35910]